MELNEAEKKGLRIILEQVFSRQETAHWKMNEKVLKITAEMFARTKACSTAIDFVPRPGVPTATYFRRQLRNIARRLVERGRNYDICEGVARWQWKPRIDRAGQGG